MVLINALNNVEESLSFFRHLIAAVQPTISAFNRTSFFHTSKVGNTIAHNLAKYAKHVRSLSVWMEDRLWLSGAVFARSHVSSARGVTLLGPDLF